MHVWCAIFYWEIVPSNYCGLFSSQVDDELADIDLTDPDLHKAATKIQASFRGHKVRKEGTPKDGEHGEEMAAGQWAVSTSCCSPNSMPEPVEALSSNANVMIYIG